MTSLQPAPFPPPWASAFGYAKPERYPFEEPLVYPFVELELALGVAMRLRWVPPGDFLMGSPEGEGGRAANEGPQHRVRISRGLWLCDTPCTQAQWEAVMGSNPSRFASQDDSPARPVEQVSWEDCEAFCRKLTERFPGLAARLPTEAEWEYACRAGTTSAFNDGSPCTVPDGNDRALAKLGWFSANSGSETHPVGQLRPNRWGLYDLHGNVWEWCTDWYNPYVDEEQRDPTGPTQGQDRVFRGGSWFILARACRSALRYWGGPGYRFDDLGFRLAAVQPAP